MCSLLYPDQRVPRKTNFLNKHVSELRRAQSLNHQKQAEVYESQRRQSQIKSKLLEGVAPRYLESPRKDKASPEFPEQMQTHDSFGRIPTYLKRMDQEKERQAEMAAEKARLADIPAGCRELTEEERVVMLEEGQKKRRSILDELKHLPLRIETLGQRRRKIELEHELTSIESSLEKLTRKTVLIQL